MLGPNHKRLHRTTQSKKKIKSIWKFHSNQSRMFKIISPLLLYKPHIWALISISCLLKITSWVCGSLSKHRVHRLSNGCPTECCHGSQRLALKKCWKQDKELKCLHNVIWENYPCQMRFWGLPCFCLAPSHPTYSCNLNRTFSDGLWNQSLMSVVFFCLCALADAYLNKQQICLSICLFFAAFVALKEPNNYYISIPDGLRITLEKPWHSAAWERHLRTIKMLNLGSEWLNDFSVFYTKFWQYILCLNYAVTKTKWYNDICKSSVPTLRCLASWPCVFMTIFACKSLHL